MKFKVKVDRLDDGKFLVTIIEGATQSKHKVTLKDSDYERLAASKPVDKQAYKATDEKADKVAEREERQALIRRSFEFLLEREPKESILPAFDLLEIARYFPDFERTITRRESSQ